MLMPIQNSVYALTAERICPSRASGHRARHYRHAPKTLATSDWCVEDSQRAGPPITLRESQRVFLYLGSSVRVQKPLDDGNLNE